MQLEKLFGILQLKVESHLSISTVSNSIFASLISWFLLLKR